MLEAGILSTGAWAKSRGIPVEATPPEARGCAIFSARSAHDIAARIDSAVRSRGSSRRRSRSHNRFADWNIFVAGRYVRGKGFLAGTFSGPAVEARLALGESLTSFLRQSCSYHI